DDDIYSNLRQHDDMFFMDSDGGLRLRFDSRDVGDAVVSLVQKRLEEVLQKPDGNRVYGNGPYLTPTLPVLDRWVRSDEVLKRFGWYSIDAATLPALSKPLDRTSFAKVRSLSGQGSKSLQDFETAIQNQLASKDFEKSRSVLLSNCFVNAGEE